MSEQEVKNVHIGEVKTGRSPDVLEALLGSCVGIGLIWPTMKVYGLAHCLLAEAKEEEVHQPGGRYVNQAINSIIRLLEVPENRVYELRAIVAGGGNMTKPEDTPQDQLVGFHNSSAAFRYLREKEIKVIFEDVGGVEGRKMTIDCESGHFEVKKIPRNAVA